MGGCDSRRFNHAGCCGPRRGTGGADPRGTGSDSRRATGSDPPQSAVNLAAVTNAHSVGFNLTNVMDTFGNTSAAVTATMGVLLGDTNGNGTVNASDVSQTKAQAGQVVTMSNFRTDVNVNGSINSSDVGAVKSQAGTSLPIP